MVYLKRGVDLSNFDSMMLIDNQLGDKTSLTKEMRITIEVYIDITQII